MSQKGKLELSKIEALNEKQAIVLKARGGLVLCGAAGTGKTFLLVYKALKAVQRGEVDSILIVRSTVSSRDVGYLPGNLDDKIKMYEEPYEGIFATLYGEPTAYRTFKKQHKLVDFKPTSFMRGNNICNTFIIVDEFQNMTAQELDSIITRVADGSSIHFCGDIAQSDLTKNGFEQFTRILSHMPDDFTTVEFGVEDIVRSGLVKRYLTTKHKLGY